MVKPDVYAEALAAIKENKPTKENRKRVEAFFEETDSATGSREQFFYNQLMQRYVLGKEKLAGEVHDQAVGIGSALAGFVLGKAIPAKQKKLVVAFLKYWKDFAEGENNFFREINEMVSEVHEDPKLQKLMRTMARGHRRSRKR